MSSLQLRHLIMGLVGLIILVVVNLSILQTEVSLNQGQVILLKLAPVDPRSLIQGDYMRLNYALAGELRARDNLPEEGQVVLKLDEQQVATFDRVYRGEALASNEILLNYRKQGWQVWVAPESFFFQEGHAEVYEAAEYAALRVADNGQSMLVGLRGEDLSPLGPPEE